MKRMVFLSALMLGLLLLWQCSGDASDEYASLIFNPISREDPTDQKDDNTSDPSWGISPTKSDLLDEGVNGYSLAYNAKLVVQSMDTHHWDPKFDYIADWLLGIRLPNEAMTPSDTTRILFFPDRHKVYIHATSFHPSILGYEWMRWDLTYRMDGNDLELEGVSKAIGGMIYCNTAAEDTSLNTFHFQGTYDESLECYKGTYTWSQDSTETACAFSCTGAMVILLNELRF